MSSSVDRQTLLQQIATPLDSEDFNAVALQLFRYQATHNPLYARFLELLSVSAEKVTNIRDIPYLPIALFKQYAIKTGKWPSRFIFRSSGTTGQVVSRHHLRSADWYRNVSFRCFEQQYGGVKDWCILALLPAYLERSDSSLVHMVHQFIEASSYEESGFFLSHQNDLIARLLSAKESGIPVLLIGVSFALLDFAEAHPMALGHCTLMETGGMKGRRKEITRQELHQTLQQAFGVTHVHSEYGMTELLSQAYSQHSGIFAPGPTMRVVCREITDPLHLLPPGRTGVLNIIDLANIDTIAFIATDDLGKVYPDGTFEVLGRLDHADIRGCNLMILP